MGRCREGGGVASSVLAADWNIRIPGAPPQVSRAEPGQKFDVIAKGSTVVLSRR
jgi:hypothetical protein